MDDDYDRGLFCGQLVAVDIKIQKYRETKINLMTFTINFTSV